MSYIIAKENPKNPEGWTYIKNSENIESISTTYFKNEAYIFNTKEEASKIYWLINHYFYGYKIYNS